MKNQDSTRAKNYIWAAVIGAIAVIAAAVLGNDSVMQRIMEKIDTKTEGITLYSQLESGSAVYLGGDTLLSFGDDKNITAVGDSSGDQIIKTFITFYLGDIPDNAKIINAKLFIPCGVIGSPQFLGKLILRRYDYGIYEQTDFNNVPNNTWAIYWKDSSNVVTICNQKHLLTVSIQPVVDEILRSGNFAQFVLYFKDEVNNQDLIIPNQEIDAITIYGYPYLYVKYHYRQDR